MHSKSDDRLSVGAFEVGPEDAPLVAELLAGRELSFASWRNRHTGRSIFRVYSSPENEAETFRELTALLGDVADMLTGEVSTLERASIPKEDWSEAWKKHFHTFRASKRLVVKPSWEDFVPAGADIVVEIDPGMTFGTGYHGTTRACLEFLDDLAFEMGVVSLLDAGCGSGILCLAAARLGYAPIGAFDHDPDAVRVTAENLAAAGGVEVVPVCSELVDYVPPTLSRVVVANILATVLIEHAERLISFVDHRQAPGYLILSGILTEQYPEVKRRFAELGAAEEAVRTLDEWTSGRFVLPAGTHIRISGNSS